MAEKDSKTPSAKKKPNKFVGWMKRVAKFFRDCKGEMKKIVWPTPKAALKSTGVVLVTIIVVGLFVFGIDTLFMKILGLVMNVSTG